MHPKKKKAKKKKDKVPNYEQGMRAAAVMTGAVKQLASFIHTLMKKN